MTFEKNKAWFKKDIPASKDEAEKLEKERNRKTWERKLDSIYCTLRTSIPLNLGKD